MKWIHSYNEYIRENDVRWGSTKHEQFLIECALVINIYKFLMQSTIYLFLIYGAVLIGFLFGVSYFSF